MPASNRDRGFAVRLTRAKKCGHRRRVGSERKLVSTYGVRVKCRPAELSADNFVKNAAKSTWFRFCNNALGVC
jgi:hypothetical protein